MNVVGALASLVIGLAYVWLGLIVFHELRSGRRERGLSPFGVAFMLMALTCGPHHLAHFEHMLFHTTASDPLTVVALLLGLPAGVLFVGLRMEALRGGRGDRVIVGTPVWLALLPVVGLLAAGALCTLAVQRTVAVGGVAWQGLPSLALAGAFVVVGSYLFRAQVARGGTAGWSVSGLALAAIFPTCALMHLALGLGPAADVHLFAIDLVGVPCALYFLWVVNRLFHAGLRDWNSQPLAGRAQPTSRSSPWLPTPEREWEPERALKPVAT
jgi:hypothetical protein